MTIPIQLLELHAANVCNLTCESCSHFSNNGHKGYLDLDAADEWMLAWNRRVAPSLFRILGGEPTLNPRLTELLRLSAKRWPSARLAITTNGFFLHRHPDLPRVLSLHGGLLRLTVHDKSPEYLERVQEIWALLQAWRSRWYFDLIVERSYERWTRRYRGFGEDVLPFEDENPRASWEQCPCRNCVQLFRGRLWKCSPIAYLRLQKEAYPSISERWDRYLAYQGIGPECSDGELEAFMAKEEEPICGMCAAAPERFDKDSPLIPLNVLRSAGNPKLAGGFP